MIYLWMFRPVLSAATPSGTAVSAISSFCGFSLHLTVIMANGGNEPGDGGIFMLRPASR